jgi:hypothetical protein
MQNRCPIVNVVWPIECAALSVSSFGSTSQVNSFLALATIKYFVSMKGNNSR